MYSHPTASLLYLQDGRRGLIMALVIGAVWSLALFIMFGVAVYQGLPSKLKNVRLKRRGTSVSIDTQEEKEPESARTTPTAETSIPSSKSGPDG